MDAKKMGRGPTVPAYRSGIDVSLIPRVDLINLCRTTLEAVEEFYQHPENVHLYEKWKREQEGLKSATPSE